jgi:glycosyltransferase involved in cell wall biosynthesis
MRILHASHISNYTPPVGYGGIELMVDTLAREQVTKGHEILVLGVKPRDVETPYGLRAAFAKPVGRPGLWHKLYYSLTLLKAAGFGDFDVVHIHVQWLIPAASLIERLTKRPTVLTLHADPSKAVAKFYVPMVAISQSQKSRLKGLGIKPVAVIYNGIDIKRYPFRTDKGDFFVYLGRIDETKGLHIAIEAVKKLNEKLVIMGPITNHRYFNTFIKSFIDNKGIIYLGEVDFETKVEYLSRAKALLYPVQYDEFFGIAMVEALATGTPVIGFQRGSVAEIVRDGVTGYLVKDTEEMRKAMKSVDKLNTRECRRDVERRFSSVVMAERYEELYKTLLGKL